MYIYMITMVTHTLLYENRRTPLSQADRNNHQKLANVYGEANLEYDDEINSFGHRGRVFLVSP